MDCLANPLLLAMVLGRDATHLWKALRIAVLCDFRLQAPSCQSSELTELNEMKKLSRKSEVVEDERGGYRVASPIDIFLNRLR